MARTAAQEVLYLPLANSGAIKFEGAKAILTDTKQEFKALPYEVEFPGEPLLFRIYIPKVTVKKLNATFTLFIEDVTGAAQIIAEATAEGITAASNTGPVLIERRFTPGTDATVEKELSGERKFTLQGESSAEEVNIPVNTAKCVAFMQILGLGRD